MLRLITLIIVLLTATTSFGQRPIVKGSVDQTTYIRIIDSADGTPETGVVTATSGLDLEYVRLGAAPTDLTESDLAATDSTHSDGGIKHVGGGNYRVDLPDAAVATGVNEVMVQGTITGMIVIPTKHALINFDIYDADPPVDATKLNGTALTGRDIGASVLLSSGTGTGQVSLSSGTVTVGTNNDKTGYALTTAPPTAVAIADATATHATFVTAFSNIDSANTNASSASVSAASADAKIGTPVGADLSADIAAKPTATQVWAAATRSLTDKSGFALTQAFPTNFATLGINASGHVSRVALVDTITTYTGNTPQAGDSFAIVSSVSHGNAALKTLIDTLDNLVDTEINTLTAGVDTINESLDDSIDGLTAIKNSVVLRLTTTDFNDMIDNVPTVAEFNARTLTSASYATAAELATKPTAAEVWTNGTRSLTDKEGFSLTQTFPPNFAAFDLDASGRVNIGEILDTPQTSGFDLWLITEQLPKVLLDTTVASVTSQTVFVVNNGWGSANLGATYLAGQLVIFRNASLGQNYEPSVRRVVSFDNVTKTLTIDSACSFTVGVEDEVRILPDKDVAGGGGLTSQETRDAMKLAPTAGAAASGSIDKKLDTAITR